MKHPLFLLGAGFNKDAKQEAGPVIKEHFYMGEYKIDCQYPLLNDLIRICFEKESVGAGISIEECFATALKEKNYKPLRRLYDTLMNADYYLIPKLLPDGDNPNNCYARFFEHYNKSSFLTFNYDSMPEIFLLTMGQWHPHDGYGVPVEVVDINHQNCQSSNLVLHLHGSLCIYKTEFDLVPVPGSHIQRVFLKEKPDYIFDPESISSLFSPYNRPPLRMTGYEPIEFRVIAPVPDKAEGFRQKFIRDVCSRARQLICESDELIAIGYNFSPYDKSSYHYLLEELGTCEKARALLVSPSATEIEERLKNEYPKIDWQSISMTFKTWVEAGFPKSM